MKIGVKVNDRANDPSRSSGSFTSTVDARVAYGNDGREGGSRDVSMLDPRRQPARALSRRVKVPLRRYSWRNAFHFFRFFSFSFSLSFFFLFLSFSFPFVLFRFFSFRRGSPREGNQAIRSRNVKRFDRSFRALPLRYRRKSSPPSVDKTRRVLTCTVQTFIRGSRWKKLGFKKLGIGAELLGPDPFNRSPSVKNSLRVFRSMFTYANKPFAFPSH